MLNDFYNASRNSLIMRINRVLIFLSVLIFGCNYNGGINSVKDTVASIKSVPEELIRLDKVIFPLLKEDSVNRAITIVDSLILKNNKDGAFYYERAFLYEYNRDFEQAISYYTKAENLGFNKTFCVDKISYCKKLINDRLKIERTHRIQVPI